MALKSLIFIASLCLLIYFASGFKLDGNNQSELLIYKTVQCVFGAQECLIEIPGRQSISLSFAPQPIVAMEPIKLSVEGDSLDSLALVFWFKGKVMDMGQHFLLPEQNLAETRTYRSYNGMIPICSIDPDMSWVLQFSLNAQGQTFLYTLEYSFLD